MGHAVDVFKFPYDLLIDDIPYSVHPAATSHLQSHELVRHLLRIDFHDLDMELLRQRRFYRIDPFLELQIGIFQIGLLGVIDDDHPPSLIRKGFDLLDAFQHTDRAL